jgi:hypothetical protein
MTKHRARLRSSTAHRNRLAALKVHNDHLDKAGRGLMIDDPETVALIEELASRLGLSKRETVRRALDLAERP